MYKDRMMVLTRTSIVLLTVAILVTLSYFYLDKPIAWWAFQHKPVSPVLLKAITKIPMILEISTLVYYVGYLIAWGFGKITPLMNNLLAAANALAITDFIHDWAKYAFGRYWPMTWVENNPSLINTHEYGFHFFYSKLEPYHSFPSGRVALTIAVMTYIGLAYPRLRKPAIAISVLVSLSLVAMDYHFLADTIGGAGLGGLVAYLYYKIANPGEIER